MNDKCKDALNDYCRDHKKHFGCYPMDFTYEGKVYYFNEFEEFIYEEKSDEV